MQLQQKEIFVFIDESANIKYFEHFFNKYLGKIQKQATIYFDIETPVLVPNLRRLHEFQATFEKEDSPVTEFYVFTKSMDDFKKSNPKLDHKVNMTPTWLTAVFLDNNKKDISYVSRKNFEEQVIDIILVGLGLKQFNTNLSNISPNNGFIYHQTNYAPNVTNTVLNTFDNLDLFISMLDRTDYIACDTEFFNIEQKVINTVIDCYLRTVTFSLLVFNNGRVEHHTFEFAIEEHLEFNSTQYDLGIKKLKKAVGIALTNKANLFLHNASADLHILCRFAGVDIRDCNGIADTISLHFADSPDTPKDLKKLIYETDPVFINYDKELDKINGNTQSDELIQYDKYFGFKPEVIQRINEVGELNINSKWIFAPLTKLLQYNAIDSFVTLNLGMRYIHKDGLQSMFYHNQLKFITIPFLSIEQNGLPLDKELLYKYIDYCNEGALEYQTKLDKLGILTYYRLVTKIKNNTVLIAKTEQNLINYLSKKGLGREYWVKYVPTKKYVNAINNYKYENDICKSLVKKTAGNLHIPLEIELPNFVEPFNFASPVQKVDLFYEYLGLEELLTYNDTEFHERVLYSLKRENPNLHQLFKSIKTNKSLPAEFAAMCDLDLTQYDFSKLYDQMKFINNYVEVKKYSRFERKTDENVMGNILKHFGDAPAKSKAGLLFQIALLIQSAAKISKTAATYLHNYRRSSKYTLGECTTHSSFRHAVRTSRQSSGGSGVNFQNVTDSKRIPKRYEHLKPYVATIKKVVRFPHTEFSDAVKAEVDFKNKQLNFTTFNTVLKNHGTKRVLIEFDYSQIELYILAMMANVKYMSQAIKEGKDLHSMTAALTLFKTYEQYMAMTKEEKGNTRHDSKTMNFTYSFLGSARSAQEYGAKMTGVVLPLEHWQKLEEKFHAQYSEIRPFAFTAFRHVLRTGVVNTITGHTRQIKDEHIGDFNTVLEMYQRDGEPFDILEWCKNIPYKYKQVVMKIMRKAVNTQIQGSANAYTAISVGMNYHYINAANGRTNEVNTKYPLNNPMPKSVVQHNVVHDAQYVSCEIQDIVATVRTYNEVLTERIKDYMLQNFGYATTVPLKIGCSIGDSWYEMTDFDVLELVNNGKFVAVD